MPAADRVDIWRIADCAAEADVEPLHTVLSDDERARAARLLSEPARQTFVAVRAALRHVLGEYLGAPPASLRFEYGRWGKPRLADASRLHFSVTHSGTAAAIAVGAVPLGIDLEVLRPVSADVAEESLTPEELVRVRAASDPTTAFYAHWTLKEAYLKAVGCGLNVPLRTVVVMPGEETSVAGYRFKNVNVIEGCAAALAVEASDASRFPAVSVADWRRPPHAPARVR